MRKDYEMTQAQFDELMKACEPVPMIMLQCGNPPSTQERANAVWEKMGEEMGFDPRTVRAAARGRGDKIFSAEAKP